MTLPVGRDVLDQRVDYASRWVAILENVPNKPIAPPGFPPASLAIAREQLAVAEAERDSYDPGAHLSEFIEAERHLSAIRADKDAVADRIEHVVVPGGVASVEDGELYLLLSKKASNQHDVVATLARAAQELPPTRQWVWAYPWGDRLPLHPYSTIDREMARTVAMRMTTHILQFGNIHDPELFSSETGAPLTFRPPAWSIPNPTNGPSTDSLPVPTLAEIEAQVAAGTGYVDLRSQRPLKKRSSSAG